MNDQNTIPADKVWELADKYDYDGSANPERLLVQAISDLRALLPAQQPTTGLFGRWAKHPDYGDVVCVWDKPKDGWINIYKRANNGVTGAEWYQIQFSELTFPHQATKPEDVPAGEAWRVRHCGYGEFNAVKTSGPFPWRFFNPEIEEHDGFRNNSVTLIYPLTPERPETDLQARYDELVKRWNHLDDLYSARGSFIDELRAKYREAQEKIKVLEQDTTPRTVTTEQEYSSLPVRSVVAEPRGETWEKTGVGLWSAPTQRPEATNADLAGTTRTMLRYGWGDEHPAWRIEHDWLNLRPGEYVIDCDDDSGVVSEIVEHLVHFRSGTTTSKYYAPFIVFPNKDEATLEAIVEAKRARDKEMDK